MNTLSICLRNLRARPLAALFSLLLLTLGLACITFTLLAGVQVKRMLARDQAGFDLVVGAKGSPLQLVLAGVFHLEPPAGDIPLALVHALRRDPRVASLIPISLADSFRGYRIVGTTPDYLARYGVTFADGEVWKRTMQTVVGAEVARATGMRVHNTFISTHGLGMEGEKHRSSPFRVVGVLAPCACVLDRLILTPVESVWHVHDDSVTGDDSERDEKMDAKREITLALIQYASAQAADSLPQAIRDTTVMESASPAAEVAQLVDGAGLIARLLYGVGALLLLTGGLSLFIGQRRALRERRADFALLRMLGAGPLKLASLPLCEALCLGLLASLLGLLAGHLLAQGLGQVVQARHLLRITGWLWLPAERWLVLLTFGVALAAAWRPALRASRVGGAELLLQRP